MPPFFLTCPATQGDCSLGRREATKQLLEEDVDRFAYPLPYSCCLHGLSTPHSPQGKLSPHWEKRCWKTIRGCWAGGTSPKNTLVSRLPLYFLHAPQQNFLWISAHPLFPITLLFTLSIWRIQMLNDKKGRRRRESGGRRIPFCLKEKMLKCHPAQHLRSVHQCGRGWLNYLCVR